MRIWLITARPNARLYGPLAFCGLVMRVAWEKKASREKGIERLEETGREAVDGARLSGTK